MKTRKIDLIDPIDIRITQFGQKIVDQKVNSHKDMSNLFKEVKKKFS